jgi:hypothetical protein
MSSVDAYKLKSTAFVKDKGIKPSITENNVGFYGNNIYYPYSIGADQLNQTSYSKININLPSGESVIVVNNIVDGSTSYMTYIDSSNNLKVSRTCIDANNILGTSATFS